ncbi:MAG: PspC domain-containing protein [Anaerolineaceae bacterium]|jgi:phage shock protein PspC (stress-responsive transcriptional regulator)
MEPVKRLYRSKSDRMIAGVCGGIAQYFNIDPTLVRLLAVVGLLLAGGTFWAYIIMAIVIPTEP